VILINFRVGAFFIKSSKCDRNAVRDAKNVKSIFCLPTCGMWDIQAQTLVIENSSVQVIKLPLLSGTIERLEASRRSIFFV